MRYYRLQKKGIQLTVVSSSPSSYAQQVAQHFGRSFDVIVFYHDTTKHKPHPASFIEAINRFKITALNQINVDFDRIDFRILFTFNL